MSKTKKKMWITGISGLALVAVVAGIWFLGSAGTAKAAENLQAIVQESAQPGLLGEGYLTQGGGWNFPGMRGGEIDYQQLLADALGITVEDLQAAHQTARDAALDQAVTEGLITQEQADEMKVWGGSGRRGGFERGIKGVTLDENTLLAKALNITVEQLQAARTTANQVAIDRAIAEGLITQEQADTMQARKNLMAYLKRDTLLAQALGMAPEELQAAYDEGQTLSDLITAKGLDATTVREKLQTAYKDVLAQAVKDGVITQEQADEMQNDGRGFGFMPGRMPDNRMGPGGHEGFRGRGGFDNDCPCAPDADTEDDTSGSGWRTPGRQNIRQGDDA